MSPVVPIIILLIAIPIFFILRWLLKRIIHDNKRRNWISIFAALLIAPILYIGLIIAFFSYLFHEPRVVFEREKWFADKNSRHEMRDHIVESNILIGKSKLEIIDFIGDPEYVDTTEIWKYDLGMSVAGFGWRFNSLELTFKHDTVTSVKKIEVLD